MEPLTMFASTVGFIGAFHLLSLAVERFGREGAKRSYQPDQRKDWYCFFALSDLLGANSKGAEMTKTQRETVSEAERQEQLRRQQAHRPRLHV